jgi:putative (di)nucleoside polyphosphate hydrolase
MGSMTFRAGVAMIVRRGDGHVLVFERRDAPGSWQLPQGGIDADETPLEAAWRELSEETGLDQSVVRLVDETPDWISYLWPTAIRTKSDRGRNHIGQTQKWFLFGVADDHDGHAHHLKPRPDGREFADWKWMSPHEVIDQVIEWRRSAYQRAFSRLLP